jgi:hypothetical protein
VGLRFTHLLLLAGLAGCHAVLPLDRPGPDGSPDGPLNLKDQHGGPTLLLADNFDDDRLDTDLWWLYANKCPKPAEQNERLTISLPANTPDNHCLVQDACYAGIGSMQYFSFVNASVQVEVVQVITAGSKGDQGLYAYVGPSQNQVGMYGIYYANGRLVSGYLPAGSESWDKVLTTYDATSHRHWRISHDPGHNTIRFWASKDGASWKPLHSMPNKVDLSQVGFSMEAGVWASVPSPGQGVFDNFRAERLGP